MMVHHGELIIRIPTLTKFHKEMLVFAITSQREEFVKTESIFEVFYLFF
jgi:hypothetical protein